MSTCRRNFLATAIGTVLISKLEILTNVSASDIDSDTTTVDPESWLTKAIKIEPKKSISGTLELARFKDAYWIVLSPILWIPPQTGPYKHLAPVTVPKGFVTDLASVPSLFWFLAPRDGDYAIAAVIHDYLYWIQDRTREDADLVLNEGMEYLDTVDKIRIPIYKSVKWFGSKAWSTNKELRLQGEKKVLKKFPIENNVLWDEWRKLDVF